MTLSASSAIRGERGCSLVMEKSRHIGIRSSLGFVARQGQDSCHGGGMFMVFAALHLLH
jgi:hypothetical protein